jgi:hypothetical protein
MGRLAETTLDVPKKFERHIGRITAKLLIVQHGKLAEIEAARLFDLMTVRQDFEGLKVWRWIERAIKELRSKTPAGPMN